MQSIKLNSMQQLKMNTWQVHILRKILATQSYDNEFMLTRCQIEGARLDNYCSHANVQGTRAQATGSFGGFPPFRNSLDQPRLHHQTGLLFVTQNICITNK